jgi:hypothetical protein
LRQLTSTQFERVSSIYRERLLQQARDRDAARALDIAAAATTAATTTTSSTLAALVPSGTDSPSRLGRTPGQSSTSTDAASNPLPAPINTTGSSLSSIPSPAVSPTPPSHPPPLSQSMSSSSSSTSGGMGTPMVRRGSGLSMGLSLNAGFSPHPPSGPPPSSAPMSLEMGGDEMETKVPSSQQDNDDQAVLKRKMATLATETQNAYLLFRDLCTICRGEPSIKVLHHIETFSFLIEKNQLCTLLTVFFA